MVFKIMENIRNISILGSTGSIGTQTLSVAREHKNIRIKAITANSNVKLLEQQAREFNPELICVANEKAASDLKTRLADCSIKIFGGRESLSEAAVYKTADTIVTAVVGISGLMPTVDAIKAGKNIALANKETLVTGGHIVTKLARENNVSILPVDSEHSAIFQSLMGNNKKRVKNIILTASGGPFFGKTREDLTDITPQQALKHPNWNMGAKVTIDSSTLVNKGLEVIEAKWLFGVNVDSIRVLVHRQSIVHSMVEYEDNAVIAQLGTPDMRVPIQFALTYPDRLSISNNTLDLVKAGALTFEEPDTDTFIALSLARKAIKAGGIMPTIFNSADEAAVELFLNGRLSYLGISDVIEKAMDSAENIKDPSLEDIFAADKAAKEFVYSIV